MFWRRRRALRAVALAALAGNRAAAHPQCLGVNNDPFIGTADYRNAGTAFCTLERMGGYLIAGDGTCCNQARDDKIRQIFAADVALDGVALSATAQAKHKTLLCSECHPFAGHLYEVNAALTQVPMQQGGYLLIKSSFLAAWKTELLPATKLHNKYLQFLRLSAAGTVYSYPFDPADFWVTGGTKNLPPVAFPHITMPATVMSLKAYPGKNFWWCIVKTGKVYEFANAATATTMKLAFDLSSEIYKQSEGLMDIAFDPNFATNQLIYAYYTTLINAEEYTRLSQFKYTVGNNAATLASEKQLFVARIVEGSHKGGTMEFYEGNLYLPTGDGGGENDPLQLAQNEASLLGKVLRMKVSATGVVTGTGFVGPQKLVFAKGLRNPHKLSIDAATGELWIGDCGQEAREKVNMLRLSAVTGLKNFGWPMWEGNRCNLEFAGGGCSGLAYSAVTKPFFEYCHPGIVPGPLDKTACLASLTGGCIIGGRVYRGKRFPKLYGHYVFVDYMTGMAQVLFIDRSSGIPVVTGMQPLQQANTNVASIAVDSAGELYYVHHKGQDPSTIWALGNCGALCQ